jgi:hypothetical protein
MTKKAAPVEPAPVTSITTDYKAMTSTLERLAPDVQKAEAGNKAAETRLRVAMSKLGKDTKAYRALLLKSDKAA